MKIEVGKKLPFHTNMKKIHQRWSFWEKSVKVDEEYVLGKDANNKPIIKKFECETLSNYKQRLERTSPRNLISNIINQYTGAVFLNSPERDESIPDLDNIDGRGKSLTQIMQTNLKNTMIYGIAPLILESSSAGVQSIAQARSEGTSYRISSASPWSLINWTEVDGYLLEALISFVDESGNNFARLYDTNFITDIFFDQSQKVTGIGEPIAHGFSNIPVVFQKLNIINDSFVQPLAQIQMNVNNILSLLGTEQFSQTFTRWVLSGIEGVSDMSAEERENWVLSWGSNDLIILPNQVNVDRLGADITQSESLRKSIEQDSQELNKTAGLIETAVSSDASGEARKLAKSQFKTTASLMTDSCEEAENKIIRLISEITGATYNSSSYDDIYEIPDYTEEIMQLRDILSLQVSEEIKQRAIDNFEAKFFI